MTLSQTVLFLFALILVGLTTVEFRRWRLCRAQGMQDAYPNRRFYRRLASGLLFLCVVGLLLLIDLNHPLLAGAKAMLAALATLGVFLVVGIVLTLLDFIEASKGAVEAAEIATRETATHLMKELDAIQRLKSSEAGRAIQSAEREAEK